ncbi:cysteine hydrolase family protein [Pedobacter sp. SYSU D00535]|uniref:cysteine hydrolase family protein n=1 Tax=Pedobacter sp. SYSU D00535 TaxID=2810308 RepID=UPI001F608E8E|nr:cysteine hydrolase family protein [Pedobacter sp. SYSU D00535]
MGSAVGVDIIKIIGEALRGVYLSKWYYFNYYWYPATEPMGLNLQHQNNIKKITMAKKALILIDIQNEYFEKGALELVNPVPASENARKVLERFREQNLPIVHIQHIMPAGAPFFIEGTNAVEIHDNVKPKDGEKLFVKQFPNSFRDTGLLEHLKSNDITDLVILGMMTHMCVDATTRAAFDFGFNCTVIGDACASKDLEIKNQKVKAIDVHNANLAALDFFYAKIQDTEEYLSA